MAHERLSGRIHRVAALGHFRLTRHAITEGMKDGILPPDIASVLVCGEVIEDYRPFRQECRMLGYSDTDNIPIHVAVNFEDWTVLRVKTCYVPQADEWINDRMRK